MRKRINNRGCSRIGNRTTFALWDFESSSLFISTKYSSIVGEIGRHRREVRNSSWDPLWNVTLSLPSNLTTWVRLGRVRSNRALLIEYLRYIILQVYINWLDSHFAKVEVESSSLFTCSTSYNIAAPSTSATPLSWVIEVIAFPRAIIK